MAGSLALGGAAPAAAGEIYSWRTDEGGYAFADDIDAVPERYRAHVDVRRSAPMASYRRYTVQDERADRRYQEQLAARLEQLRARNANAGQEVTAPANHRAPDYVTIGSGARRGNGVGISTPMSGSDAPLEIETVYMKRDGGLLTQPVRVTRRGDRVISIEKPRDSYYSLDDAIPERELDSMLEE